MKATEAIEFAKHVDPKETMSQDVSEYAVLNAVYQACPASVKANVLKDLLDKAERWRNPDTCVSATAHELWYPHHLQIAARAAQLLQPN